MRTKLAFAWSLTYNNLVEVTLKVLKISEVEVGKIFVHENNTFELYVTFLATRHTTVCLNLLFMSQ